MVRREVDLHEFQTPVKNRFGGQRSPFVVGPNQLQVMGQARAWLGWAATA
jgi:hypothetical protein